MADIWQHVKDSGVLGWIRAHLAVALILDASSCFGGRCSPRQRVWSWQKGSDGLDRCYWGP